MRFIFITITVKFLVLISTWLTVGCCIYSVTYISTFFICIVNHVICLSKTDWLVIEYMYWIHFLFIDHSWLMFSPVIYGWRKVELYSKGSQAIDLTSGDPLPYWLQSGYIVGSVVKVCVRAEEFQVFRMNAVCSLHHYHWMLCGSVYSIHRISDWLYHHFTITLG